MIRTDKFISSQLADISRSEAKALIRSGRVAVDGVTVRSPDTQITPQSVVTLDGKRITYKEHIYIMLNKPSGYVCSTKREGGCPTVIELVPPYLKRKGLFAAGRLDKDTEGFVLITDDGELAHKMLAPSSHVPKTYFVRLEQPCGEDYEQRLAQGVDIGGEICRPAVFAADKFDEKNCTLIIHEGKFHQVKRMFASLGNKVVYLKRTAIGALVLDPNLPLGECLEIMHKDVDKLLCH